MVWCVTCRLVPSLPLAVPHTLASSSITSSKGIVNSIKLTMRSRIQQHVWSQSSHNNTLWNLRLSSSISQQSPVSGFAPFAPVLFVCAWCPFFCPSRTKEELTSTHLFSNKHANDFEILMMLPRVGTLGQASFTPGHNLQLPSSPTPRCHPQDHTASLSLPLLPTCKWWYLASVDISANRFSLNPVA